MLNFAKPARVLVMITVLAWLGCGGDDPTDPDPGGDDGNGNGNGGEVEVVDGLHVATISGVLGLPGKAGGDKTAWDPRTEPVSPEFGGYRLSIRNLSWEPSAKDDEAGSINGEWRLERVTENGVSYLVQCRIVSRSEFAAITMNGGDMNAMIGVSDTSWEDFVVHLTQIGNFDFDVEISWTGTIIVYDYDWDPIHAQTQVCATDTTGSRWVYLTDHERSSRDPAISPDGEWVAFVSTREDFPNRDIWAMRVDGTELHMLTDDSDSNIMIGNFSPNGSTLVFTFWSEDTGTFDIGTVTLGGSRANLTESFNVHETYPMFSMESSRITFVKGDTTETGQEVTGYKAIWIMDRDGTDQIKVCDGSPWGNDRIASLPIVSPDGTRILFTGAESNPWVVDIDGQNLTELLRWDEDDSVWWTTWTPDGSELLISCRKRYRSHEIYRVSLDSMTMTQMTRAYPWNARHPDWGPRN